MLNETCLSRALERRSAERKKASCYLEAAKSEREFLKELDEQKERERNQQALIEHPSDYLQNKLFPQLIPALEQTVYHAIKRNIFDSNKQIFNGVDYLSEVLWNKNPKHPDRRSEWRPAFYIFHNKTCLCDRPIYPLSWVWPKNLAAIIIQRNFRGYLVRKTEEVQEMRQFWNAIKEEKWILQIPTPEEEYIIPEKISVSERVF